MKKEELKPLLKEITDRINNEWSENSELSDSWEKDISKYNNKYLIEEEYCSYGIFWDDYKRIKWVIEDIEEWLNDCSWIWVHTFENDDAEDNYGEHNIWIKYYTIIPHVRLEDMIKIEWKYEIRGRLKKSVDEATGKNNWQRNIDCKLLQLFEDWTFDWETLARLVYTDCNL